MNDCHGESTGLAKFQWLRRYRFHRDHVSVSTACNPHKRKQTLGNNLISVREFGGGDEGDRRPNFLRRIAG